MCTIGNVFIPETKGIISFKQCDLTDETEFTTPTIEYGKGDIRYLSFRRVGGNGPWAGVNNKGVSFVAADAYLEKDSENKAVITAVSDDIFAAYTKIISDCTTAEQAAKYMSDFYIGFGKEDILLINDATSAYFIETYAGVVKCIKRTDNFFASTNHFRMLDEGVLYPKNHSTYLRLARAESILATNTNSAGPFKVLEDQYYGETIFSICRVNSDIPKKPDFYTQASAVFYTDGKKVNCAYQINGNPRMHKYTSIQDVFGAHLVTENASATELQEIILR